MEAAIGSIRSALYIKHVSIPASISGNTLTYDISSKVPAVHGLFLIEIYSYNVARYSKLIVSNWSETKMGEHSQNTVGSITFSGFIESGNYKAVQTFSSAVSGGTCEVYWIQYR